MSDDTNTPQEAPAQDSVDPTDSAVTTMPSEVPEAPRDAVIVPAVKDDNLAGSESGGQIAELGQTTQIPSNDLLW